MQNLNMVQFSKLLHPGKDKRPQLERILESLSKSNPGTAKTATNAPSALDSFQLTKHISELLSPACGMSEEEKQKYLSEIMAKLKKGKALTGEEMRFLQSVNPQLYLDAARVQTMRESLKSQLEHCQSREDAKTAYSNAISFVGKDDTMKEYIVAAYQDVMKEFQKSGDWKSLPESTDDKNQTSASSDEKETEATTEAATETTPFQQSPA